MSQELLSIVIPALEEGENIGRCLAALDSALGGLPREVLVCLDPRDRTTRAALAAAPIAARLVESDGPGFGRALSAGFSAAAGDVVVVVMADLSDDPALIPKMAEKIRRGGAAVVSGSRVLAGGGREGGPILPRILARLAGASLKALAGLPTEDPTNNFRAYSADFLRMVTVETRTGFAVGLELTVKAHLLGLPVAEVPATWRERESGRSKARLLRDLPGYLRWYLTALLRL